MATRDPKYLRLADRIAIHGCRHDLNTGFGISGFDVVEFPEDEDAAKFCRLMVRRGIFEEASKAEFDEVDLSDPDVGEEIPKVMMVQPGHMGTPEYLIQSNLRTPQQKMSARIAARSASSDDDEDDDGEPRRGAAKKAGARKRSAKKDSEDDDE